jgi:hypothetical protein
VNGYLEGRTMADVHSLKKMKELEMQMQFEALPEAAKQRVLRIQEAANRAPEAAASSAKLRDRFRGRLFHVDWRADLDRHSRKTSSAESRGVLRSRQPLAEQQALRVRWRILRYTPGILT